MGTVPKTTSIGVGWLQTGLKVLLRSLPRSSPQGLEDFCYAYSGSKREMYLKACEDYRRGFLPKHANVTMFVKVERVYPSASKIDPDPRAIQFRHPVYCAAVAQFLKPIEHNLYQACLYHRLTSNSRVVGKGLNQRQRAKLLLEKFQSLDNSVAVSLDCSRFDKHVSVEQLKCEHKLYESLCPSKQFKQLLKYQLRNKCYTRSGFRYITKGRRMSGDMNTALGNCVIMIMMLVGYCIRYDLRFEILDDGDDAILFVQRPKLSQVVETIGQHFLEYGHEVKIESVATSMEEVDWCQSRPIQYKPGKWKMVRNPMKVINSCLCSNKFSEHNSGIMVNAIGLCELVLNQHVPVLQSYAAALIRNTRDVKSPNFTKCSNLYRAKLERRDFLGRYNSKIHPINDIARDSFHRAFGISISSQIAFEQLMETWKICMDWSDIINVGPNYDLNWNMRYLVEARPNDVALDVDAK
jgi:hypothetical protein